MKLDMHLNPMVVGSKVSVVFGSGRTYEPLTGIVVGFPMNDEVQIKHEESGDITSWIADELICLDWIEPKIARSNLIAAFNEVDEFLCIRWHSNVPATLAPRSIWIKDDFVLEHGQIRKI